MLLMQAANCGHYELAECLQLIRLTGTTRSRLWLYCCSKRCYCICYEACHDVIGVWKLKRKVMQSLTMRCSRPAVSTPQYHKGNACTGCYLRTTPDCALHEMFKIVELLADKREDWPECTERNWSDTCLFGCSSVKLLDPKIIDVEGWRRLCRWCGRLEAMRWQHSKRQGLCTYCPFMASCMAATNVSTVQWVATLFYWYFNMITRAV